MKVLYREKRPDTFEDLIGQDTVKEALQRALESGRIAHAYLFSGPRGCGKTTSARIFARCLNCAKGPGPTPCGECESCKDLARGGPGSVDVIEMDAASHGGVDDARQLRERAEYAPNRDRYKIIILDEAHMITNSAFNALLKLVEEPPEHVKFIFATTEPEKVISTIRSRTYHYAFSLVTKDIMVPYLEQIANDEGVKFEQKVFPLLARVGGGSVRDTLSFMDQLIASAKDGQVEYEFAVKLFGFTPEENISAVLNHLGDKDFASVFDDVDSMVSTGVSPKSFATDLLQWMRDAILVSIWGQHRSSANIKAALGSHSDSELDLLKSFTVKMSERLLTQYAYALQDGIKDMRDATSQRLQLELVFAKMASISEQNNPSPQTLERQIYVQQASSRQPAPQQANSQRTVPTQSDRQPSSQQRNVPTQPSQSAPSKLPENTAPEKIVEPSVVTANNPEQKVSPSTSTIDKKVSQSNWGSILGELSKIRKSAAVLLEKRGRLVGSDSNKVEIAFDDIRFGENFSNYGYNNDLEAAIATIIGRRLQVVIVSSDAETKNEPKKVRDASIDRSQNAKMEESTNNSANESSAKGDVKTADKNIVRDDEINAEKSDAQNADSSVEEDFGDYSDNDAVIDDNEDALASLQDILGATEIER